MKVGLGAHVKISKTKHKAELQIERKRKIKPI